VLIDINPKAGVICIYCAMEAFASIANVIATSQKYGVMGYSS